MPQADILLNYFGQVIKECVGLEIISTKGDMCKKARRCSRVKDAGILLRNPAGVPCCESWNIVSE